MEKEAKKEVKEETKEEINARNQVELKNEIQRLKAYAYDLIANKEQVTIELQKVNQKIAELYGNLQ